MSRWKQLPDSLDPRVRRLAVQMRRMKDHSGLGLQALAARTGYSRASWDRYLNGRSLPPQEAVAALARACDIDPARLLALHEVAVAAGRGAEHGSNHAAEAEPNEEGQDAGGDGRGRRTRAGVLASAVLASALLVTVVIALLVAAPWDGGGKRTAGRPVSASATESARGTGAAAEGAFVFRAGKDYPCKVHRAEDGLLYAGYSRTRVDLIGMGSSQWSVVEAQCLLRHHGFSPGMADGAFGSRTERAVERMQDRAHLRVDGVVGEDTWGALRK
ncbi:peptidoglycan-binding protein [Streptomyces barringtoniae]|uniref:peptidoglycan-binding protein n=1 Tax=Streptomyces barringtoniae TaxID=2892029 RepID=UPI001E3EB451|nr:peptidoglycan-binding protein [Streptomyces barringtoniae]MCC5477316.1 peptidoglycan-binding protein [Streptomyces barringtoniae]